MIRLPQDIFNLDYIRIEDMDGWGKQSVLNLKYSINARKNITFDKDNVYHVKKNNYRFLYLF